MLRIDSIRFENFRNYERLSLDGLGSLSVLVGPNAVGKTNVVEGIQLITAFGSFRSARGSELVRLGCECASIQACFLSESRDLSVGAVIRPGSRSYTVNGKKKLAQDIQGILPSVAFSPDDLALVKGPQAHRRAALDLLGCQLSRSHRIIKRDFERLIKHKNVLLKEEAPAQLLAAVNDMIVPAAARLYLYRQALVSRIADCLARAYAAMAEGDEAVEVSYVPSWEEERIRRAAEVSPMEFSCDEGEIASLLERALEARCAEERARKRAVVGPHHDRIEFFVGKRNASSFASQGQQRSIVLAWKMAEVEIVREMTGSSPVLLLDDVMSELDAGRRRALMGLLEDETQTFITATDLSYFDPAILDGAAVIRLGG